MPHKRIARSKPLFWRISGYVLLISLLLMQAGSLKADSLVLKKVDAGIEDFGYILDKTNWTTKYLSPVSLVVCWENPSPEYADQMLAVQAAITDTWQKEAAISFVGWANCPTEGNDIRIRVMDDGPHTKGLGTQIYGVPAGMVLNFTFAKWGAECADQAMYNMCVRSIAVHEFGHAIGFAHEQNRADTPGECSSVKPAQGTSGDIMLTPWDPSSVMNYCNSTYNNSGILSEFDVSAVRQAYGPR